MTKVPTALPFMGKAFSILAGITRKEGVERCGLFDDFT